MMFPMQAFSCHPLLFPSPCIKLPQAPGELPSAVGGPPPVVTLRATGLPTPQTLLAWALELFCIGALSFSHAPKT